MQTVILAGGTGKRVFPLTDRKSYVVTDNRITISSENRRILMKRLMKYN